MATMIVKHKVADFGKWKTIFDSMQPMRQSHGWIAHEVLRDSADPSLVTIVNKMRSIDDAKAYGQSGDLKEAMKNAGVLSAPEITYLNDEEVRNY